MMLSRSQTHQHEKLKRKKRTRRLLVLNSVLLGLAIIVVGVILAVSYRDKLPEWLPIAADRGVQSSGADDKNGDGKLPANGENANGDNTNGDNTNGPDGGNSSESAGNTVDSEDDEPQSGEQEDDGTHTGGLDTNGTGSDGTGEIISLSFVGDVLPEEYMTKLMEKHGEDYPYQKALFYLSEPDLMAGNLETPITTGGVPVEGMPYVYKTRPEALPVLKNVGFDVMSLANNHLLDQGVEGLRDTISHLNDAGIGHMGAGNNDEEAFAPYIKEVKGIKVAYIGLTRFLPYVSWKADRNVAGIAETYDSRRAVAAIERAKEDADLVVVMVHWGVDKMDKPEPYQQELAKQYIDAGADLVIGSHPHVLQGFEQYKGKWIAYSLGNFIFTPYPKETAAETGVLDALCSKNGDCKLKFNPMLIIEGQPTPVEGEAAQKVIDRLTSISYQVKLEENGSLVAE